MIVVASIGVSPNEDRVGQKLSLSLLLDLVPGFEASILIVARLLGNS